MSTASTPRTIIQNVSIFDGDKLSTTPISLTFKNGIITSIDPVTPISADIIIDGTGCTLLPGLIDAHVHLQTPQELHDLASYGVTTALDMACWPKSTLDPLRSLYLTETVPEMKSAGLMATAPGSLQSRITDIPADGLVEDINQAREFVRLRVEEGVDYIKIMADIPGPSQEVLNEIVKIAHENGKQVIAHATTIRAWQMAIDSEADIITHSPLDGILTDEMIEDLKRRGDVKAVVPTLIMMETLTKPPGIWDILGLLWYRPYALFGIIGQRRAQQRMGGVQGPRKYANARESVRKLYEAGIPIIAGTDAHYYQGLPGTVDHGSSIHCELEFLVEAGLSNIDALRAVTSLPARYFGMEDRGVIAVGKRADLVLVDGNPVDDIGATRRLKRVWIGGAEVGSVVSPAENPD